MGRRLDDLPPELLIHIAWATGLTSDCSRFARASRRLLHLLEDHIFRLDVSLYAGRQCRAVAQAVSLVKRGVDNKTRFRLIKKAMQAGASVNILSQPVLTGRLPPRRFLRTAPLHRAASADDIEFARVLLDGGADINVRDSNGNSALVRAIDAGSDLVMELLVLNPDQDLQCRSFRGDTLLIAAVRVANCAAFDLILPHVDPNELNVSGRTPLFLAVSQGESKMVELLLSDKRLQPDLPSILPLSMSSYPITAFVYACGLGNVSILEMLHDDDRVDVDFGGAADAVRRARASGRTQNIELLLHSKKSQYARLEIFRLACENGEARLAEEALLLAGDTERTSYLQWLAAAQRDGMEEIKKKVQDKWGRDKSPMQL